ncbi:MAG: hypothetical protein H0V01_10440 [Bacteroidetes bacterium]|nr:hypothetical protein [Bacteroidota bacterium]HET6245076.1 hypothetical protein [Bacteroidia bacterium]
MGLVSTMLIATLSFAQTNTFPTHGNVGVGTSNPSKKLHVNGEFVVDSASTFKQKVIVEQDLKIEGSTLVNGKLGIGTNFPTEKLDIATGNLRLRSQSGSGQRYAIIDNDGKIIAGNPLVPAIPGANIPNGPQNGINNNWLINGNNNINASHFLGTINNQDLRFRTNNNQQMVLNNVGFLGIGTTAPESKLHIKSDYYQIYDPVCPNPPCNPNDEIGLLSSFADVAPFPSIRFENIFTFGPTTSYHSKWEIGTDKNFFINNITNIQTEHFLRTLTIREDGNIGIGTETPSYKLDVAGNVNATGFLINGVPIAGGSNFWQINGNHVHYSGNGSVGIGTNNPAQKLHLHNGNLLLTGNTSSLLFGNGVGTGGNWGIEYDDNAGGLNFWKPSGSVGGFGNYFLFLKNNGNVGIGTDNPQAKLHVKVDNDSDKAFAAYKGTTEQFLITGDGRFYARAYRIKMGNFPDYVFEDSYKRMSPQEKSEYFNKNKRLPYMPSAKEIENDGLDVGDGLIGITRNTEENSLDIIELFEKNKVIATMNKERDEKIKNLEMEIEELKKLIRK